MPSVPRVNSEFACVQENQKAGVMLLISALWLGHIGGYDKKKFNT